MSEAEDKTLKAESDALPVALQEPVPDQPRDPPASANSQTDTRRRGILGPVLGGVLAAGLGFGLAQVVPGGWPFAATDQLEPRLDAQAEALAKAETQVLQLSEALARAEQRLSGLEAATPPDLQPIVDQVDDLAAKIDAIESIPIDGAQANPAAVAALADLVQELQVEVDGLKAGGAISGDMADLAAQTEARLKETEARAAEMKAEAEALARLATARAALGRLEAALDEGAPFAEILPDLGVEVPPVLADSAASGIQSLRSLQEEFLPSARAALDAAIRADMGDSWTERLGSFLRNQTGARSLTPREGADPDAILSRAESALAKGDLATALAELAAMPEAAQASLTEWRTKAEHHLAAAQAVQAIAKKIGG